jgi:glycine cleavage system aminomethyltransferase T
MSPGGEHLVTRRAAGLFDFSFMSLYEFHGKRELQLLQTRNLDALAPGQIAYTLLLKDGGAVLIDATVWRLDEARFWLFTGKPGRYEALDRSGQYAILALQGPASGRILSRLIGSEAVRGLRYFHFMEKDAMVIGRLGFSGELGYELLVPRSDASALRERLLGEGVPECGWHAADSLRIEAGYVLFDREIDGRANPRELGLERLVEAPVLRFAAARRLVGLEIMAEPACADLALVSLTSECLSPSLGKRIALGFAPPDSARPGTLLRLADGRAAHAARLPFHDPERRLPRGSAL